LRNLAWDHFPARRGLDSVKEIQAFSAEQIAARNHRGYG